MLCTQDRESKILSETSRNLWLSFLTILFYLPTGSTITEDSEALGDAGGVRDEAATAAPGCW